jgi:hypothetical protein
VHDKEGESWMEGPEVASLVDLWESERDGPEPKARQNFHEKGGESSNPGADRFQTRSQPVHNNGYRSQERNQIRCFSCSQVGHTKFNCPNSNRGGGQAVFLPTSNNHRTFPAREQNSGNSSIP